MLVGYTKSGKPIFKALCVIDGRFTVIGQTFLPEDHFDAHCVFCFLATLEKTLNGENEFHHHYEFLASVHYHALIVSAKTLNRPETFLVGLDAKVKHGQILANLSKIAFRA